MTKQQQKSLTEFLSSKIFTKKGPWIVLESFPLIEETMLFLRNLPVSVFKISNIGELVKHMLNTKTIDRIQLLYKCGRYYESVVFKNEDIVCDWITIDGKPLLVVTGNDVDDLPPAYIARAHEEDERFSVYFAKLDKIQTLDIHVTEHFRTVQRIVHAAVRRVFARKGKYIAARQRVVDLSLNYIEQIEGLEEGDIDRLKKEIEILDGFIFSLSVYDDVVSIDIIPRFRFRGHWTVWDRLQTMSKSEVEKELRTVGRLSFEPGHFTIMFDEISNYSCEDPLEELYGDSLMDYYEVYFPWIASYMRKYRLSKCALVRGTRIRVSREPEKFLYPSALLRPVVDYRYLSRLGWQFGCPNLPKHIHELVMAYSTPKERFKRAQKFANILKETPPSINGHPIKLEEDFLKFQMEIGRGQ